jgi:hypothetical protein
MASTSATSADAGTAHLLRWADRSHWFVLPLTGAVSFGVGLSLVFGLQLPFGGYAPLVLVVLGFGAIASAVAGLAARRARPAAAPETPARVISESWVICPSCSARSSASASHRTEAPPVRDAPPISWLLPAHSHESGPPGAGDFLWASWIPDVGKMPVELVGPVPETAYVPHREGTPKLYEEGEPVVLDLPTAGGIAGAVGTGVTLEAAAEAPTVLPAVASLETIAAEVEETIPRPPATIDAGDGITVSDLTIGDIVLWEALNPTPPHLREGTAPARSNAADRAGGVGSAYTGVRCVDCRGPVHEADAQYRCFLCRRRMCGECMEHALETAGGGCCSYCSGLQGYVLPPRTSRSRPSGAPG